MSRFDHINAELGDRDRRRVRVIPVSCSTLTELLRGKIAIEGLPPDIIVLDVRPTRYFDEAEIVTQSEKWPRLAEGDDVPREHISIRLITPCADSEQSLSNGAAGSSGCSTTSTGNAGENQPAANC